MGTSTVQLGHLLPDALDRTRAALNMFLAAQDEARKIV